MKKFQFGLQKVMEWRDRRAEQERAALEQLHTRRNRLEAERDDVKQQMANCQTDTALSKAGSSGDLQRLAGFLDALRTREGHIRQNVTRCDTEIGSQTARCLQANRDHRLLVRLHERQFANWTYELNRETEAGAAESWNATRTREAGRLRARRPG